MDIKYTNHAKYRIMERKIRFGDIKSALNDPDGQIKRFGNKLVYRKIFGTYALEVVCMKDKNKLVVITAYYV